MRVLLSIYVLVASDFLFSQNDTIQGETNLNIDTSQIIDSKKTSLGSVTFRVIRAGVSTGMCKVAVKNGVLYVVNNQNQVLPYIITRYQFSFMNINNHYRKLPCTGNLLNNTVNRLAELIVKFSNAAIDNVYATKMGTSIEVPIGGITLIKE